MPEGVVIVGVGQTGFRSITAEISYKELMFEAAVKAYEYKWGPPTVACPNCGTKHLPESFRYCGNCEAGLK